MRRNTLDNIHQIIKNEVGAYIWRNLSKGQRTKTRLCICGCGREFKYRTKYHQFYSRQCYQRMHRIPGFVKLIVDHRD